MNSSLENNLERILECAVCREEMKDAVILHCGHAFCRPCLNAYIDCDKNSCPMCRNPLTDAELLKKKFTPGLIVRHISDALSDHMKPGPSGQRMICNKHPQIERKYACERCRKLVCSECIIGDHFHKPLIQRPKDIAEIKEEMSSLVDQSEKWISAKKAYDNRLSSVKRKVDLAVSAMTDNLSQMSETLDTLEATLRTVKRLKDKLSATTSDERYSLITHKKSLETEQKQIKKWTKQISSHHSRMKEALQREHRDHADDIINLHVAHSQQVKDILSHPIPSLVETETKVNDAAAKASLSPTFKMYRKTLSLLRASLSNVGDAEEENADSGEDDTEENEDNSDNDGGNSDDRGEDATVANYHGEESDDSDEYFWSV